MKNTHGGNIWDYSRRYEGRILDFSANLNPFGMPEKVSQAAAKAVLSAVSYPDPRARELTYRLSEKLEVSPKWLFIGNGGADVIFRFVLAKRPKNAVVLAPSFSEYGEALKTLDCNITYHYLEESKGFCLDESILEKLTPNVDVLFLCEPNNPTGIVTPTLLKYKILNHCRDKGIFLFVDECFGSLTEEYHSLKQDLKNTEMFILGSFTKLYAMAGLRLGYGISSDEGLMERLCSMGQPWPVSTVSQAAGLAALDECGYAKASTDYIHKERRRLMAELIRLGIKVYGGKANYIFFYCSTPIVKKLESKGIFIRDCSNYEGLSQGFYRISVNLRQDNNRLISELEKILKQNIK